MKTFTGTQLPKVRCYCAQHACSDEPVMLDNVLRARQRRATLIHLGSSRRMLQPGTAPSSRRAALAWHLQSCAV